MKKPRGCGALNSLHLLGFIVFSVFTEVEAKGESDRLSEEQLSAAVNKAELMKITEKHRPAGTWAFWYPEADMEKTDLETGQDVRLKTRGNSPFVCESELDVCYLLACRAFL